VEAFRRLLAPARWLDWDFRAMSRHLNPDGPGCILEIGLELIGPRHAPVDPPAPAGPDRED
jgi:hypothetical protein